MYAFFSLCHSFFCLSLFLMNFLACLFIVWSFYLSTASVCYFLLCFPIFGQFVYLFPCLFMSLFVCSYILFISLLIGARGLVERFYCFFVCLFFCFFFFCFFVFFLFSLVVLVIMNEMHFTFFRCDKALL